MMVGLLLGCAVLAAAEAEEPGHEKPPWQRLLQGADARKAAVLVARLGRLREAGRFEEAVQVAADLVALREKAQGKDHWQAANARWDANGLRLVLRAGKELQDEYASAFALYRQAARLTSAGRVREAQPFLEKALAIVRKVLGEEHPDTAQSYNLFAMNLHAQSKYAEAEVGYRKALAIVRKGLGEEHPLTAGVHNNLAHNFHLLGKYAEAEQGYRKALDVYRAALGEEHPATAGCYNNLALVLNEESCYKEAEVGIRKALAIMLKVLGEEDLQTAISYNSLAFNLQAQGRYAEADLWYRKSLDLRRKLFGDEHPATAKVFNNVGHLRSAQGRHAEAEGSYRKALEIYLKVLGENNADTALGYLNVAYNLNNQERYVDAEKAARKSLELYRKIFGDEHPDTGTCYATLGRPLRMQGKYTEAEPVIRKGLNIFRKQLGEEHSDTAGSYRNLAYNLQGEGKFTEAEQEVRKALGSFRKIHGEGHLDTAESYSALANILYLQGKFVEAEKTWFAAADSFTSARLRVGATGLDRMRKTADASPLPDLAAVLARNGKFEEAWQRFEESLAHGTWDDLCARLRRPPAEQAKQDEFIAQLAYLDKLIEKTASAAALDPEQQKKRSDLLTRRLRLQDQLNDFARQLEKTYGPIGGRAFQRQEVQASLPADAALIGWLDRTSHPRAADPDGEHWAVLLRSSGPPRWVRLRGSGPGGSWTDEDTRLSSQLREALQSPRRDWRPLAQQLARQRLGPLAKYLAASDGLPAVRRLIVLPCKALAGVPAEVFAEEATVSYALSGTLYAHLRKQLEVGTQGLLAVADPVFDRPDDRGTSGAGGGDAQTWRPLPGTRVEVEALRRLFGDPRTVLTDSEASEQRLHTLANNGELKKYRYLHLATHGEMNDRFPLQSAVILSLDNLPDPAKQLDSGLLPTDGRLTAETMLREWHLNSDLVTLSACETALGKYERGEGFVGFAQALLLCGSRSVCLSLWKVDDTATALLMQRFYANLLGKRDGLKAPLPKAAALREAKQWLRTLPREEALRVAATVSKGVERSKNRPKAPLLPAVPERKAEAKEDCPYAHPYYWAAFVLIGSAE
jgi:CHAT domain-containing protein/Tfp pilus assembly protein PilF